MTIPTLDAFQVIADPCRRQILGMLIKESYNINSLVENFEISRPAISKHVKILEHAGFVNIQSKGRERYCTLNQKGFKELKVWINQFDKFWEEKLQKLEDVMNSKSNK